MELAKLFVRIAADTQEFSDGLKGATEKARSWASDVGSTVKKAGLVAITGGATVAAGAVAGIGAAALKMGMETKQATDNIQAELGTTRDEAERLGKVALRVFGNNFGGSVEDAAAVVTDIRKQLGALSDQEMQQVAQDALRIADTFELDTTEAINATGALMENFGLTSQQATDFLTSGFQRGLDSSGDFIDSITEYSTQFANGGADAAQFFSAMESGLSTGMLGTDKAADAFKEFRVRILDGSGATEEALASLGLSAQEITQGIDSGTLDVADAWGMVTDALRDTDSESLRMQAGVALIGGQFEDLGTDAVLAMDLAGTSMEDLAGSTESLNVRYSSLGNMIGGLKRKFLVALAPIGEKLLEIANKAMPHVQKAMDWFSGKLPKIMEVGEKAIESVWKWLQQNLPPALDYLSNLWTSTLQPALQTVWEFLTGSVIPALMTLAEMAMTYLVPALAAIGEWIMANVVPALQTVVGWIQENLVPAFQAIVEWLGANVVPAFQALAGFLLANVVPVIQEVAAFIQEQFGKVVAWVQENWPLIQETIQTIIDKVREIIEKILNGIRDFWENHGEQIMDFVRTTWETIKTVIDKLLSAIRGIIKAVMQMITGDWDEAWETIRGVAEDLWEAIKALIDQAIEQVKLYITIGLDAIKTVWSTVWEKVKEIAAEIWDGIKEFLAETWNTIQEKAEEIWDGIKTFISDSVENVRDTLTDIWEGLKDTLGGIWDGIKSKASEIFGRLGEIVSGAFDRVKDAWSGVFNAAAGVIKAPLNAIIGALESAVNVAIDGLNWLIDQANNIPGVNIGLIAPISLPRLDTGGLVEAAEMLAMLHGNEVVLPLSSGQTVDALAGALERAMGQMAGSMPAGTGVTTGGGMGGITVYGDLNVTAESEEGKTVLDSLAALA